MTATIDTTINVYFDTNHNVQYSPNNQIQAPADTVELVIWKGVPPLKFTPTGATVTNLSNIGVGKITFAPVNAPTGYADTVTMKIDNTGGPSNVSAKVDLGIVDTSSSSQPPVVIDGGGSIRNKGTSIWVWDLVAVIVAAFFVGYFLPRAVGAKPEVGVVAALLLVTAVGVGAAWMLFQQFS